MSLSKRTYPKKRLPLTLQRLDALLRERHRQPLWWGDVSLRGEPPKLAWKIKLSFHCMRCGYGTRGSWNAQLGNLLESAGCPACGRIDELTAEFESIFPDYTLQGSCPSGMADVTAIRYVVLNSSGAQSKPLIAASVKQALRRRRIPNAGHFAHQEAIAKTEEAFCRTFPNGSIQYVGEHEPHTTTPGPYFRVQTGDRLLRCSLSDTMRKQRVWSLIQREADDAALDRKWRQEASEYGADILRYKHNGRDQVRIVYRSRGGIERSDPIQRAREVCWGQTSFRKGEKLALACLLLMCPSDDWQTNVRPDFLKVIVNGARVNLELDAYSPTLGIALEHQGPHHYKGSPGYRGVDELSTIQERDRAKVTACAQAGVKLLVIPSGPHRVSDYSDRIASALLEAGVSPSNRPQNKDIEEKWMSLCKNPVLMLQIEIQRRFDAGGHQLVEPSRFDEIWPAEPLIYRCGNCGKESLVTRPRTLLGRSTEQGCGRGKCRTTLTAERRRQRSVAALPDHVPEWARRQLEKHPKTLFCEMGHKTTFWSYEAVVARFSPEGDFRCNHCAGEALGCPADDKRAWRAAAFQQYEAHAREIQGKTGLQPADPFRAPGAVVDGTSESVVRLVCPEGHISEKTLSQWRGLLSNTFLADRSIVPYCCEACAYPLEAGHVSDIGTNRKNTVWHRLAMLRPIHADVEYVGGFDPTGWGQERYWCGRHLPDGHTPHPSFEVSHRDIKKRSQHGPARLRFCYLCGVEHRVIPGYPKTVELLSARMNLVAQRLASQYGVPIGNPTVERIDPDDVVIDTVKTKLRFSCGKPGHAPKSTSADNYFNRAKGSGYCSECIREAKLQNADELFAEKASDGSGSNRLVAPRLLGD